MIEAPQRERTKPATPEKIKPRHTVSEGSSGGVYARFLELPPTLVLAVLWLMGVALLAVCGVALYLAATVLA